MKFETALKPWPFLVYDRWAAFLKLQLERQGVTIDLPTVLGCPPYTALLEGDHRGIVFGVEGVDDYPNSTEGVFQLWADRLQPDSPFDLDLLAEVVAKACCAGIGEPCWSEYEERMSLNRQRPLSHPAPVAAILAESRGFLFYRDQPGRVLALLLDLHLHEVDALLKGRADPQAVARQQQTFTRKLAEFDASDAEAKNLWQACLKRYRLCLPRDYLDARRANIFWALAVRRRYPQLFRKAWKAYQAAG